MVQKSLDDLKNKSLFKQQCFIDGQWLNADNGQVIQVVNPATDEIIGTVPKMGGNETKKAINAAQTAQIAWRKKTAKERSVILRRWYELMEENKDDLALILTLEQGKPLAEAKGEIQYGASYLEWFAEEAKRVYGDTIPGHAADNRISVIKQPIKKKYTGSIENLDKITPFIVTNSVQWNNFIEKYIYFQIIQPYIPKFIYYDEYYQLPSEIRLEEFQDENLELTDSLKTAKAFLELADMDLNEVLASDDYEIYKAELEATANKISDELFKYWN